jgi:hypothetical protein
MLLMASESAADPIVEAYPFFCLQRKSARVGQRVQIDELCTTARALCNIVASIAVQTAADLQHGTSVVQIVHNFDDGLHAKGLQRGRETALRCTMTVVA